MPFSSPVQRKLRQQRCAAHPRLSTQAAAVLSCLRVATTARARPQRAPQKLPRHFQDPPARHLYPCQAGLGQGRSTGAAHAAAAVAAALQHGLRALHSQHLFHCWRPIWESRARHRWLWSARSLWWQLAARQVLLEGSKGTGHIWCFSGGAEHLSLLSVAPVPCLDLSGCLSHPVFKSKRTFCLLLQQEARMQSSPWHPVAGFPRLRALLPGVSSTVRTPARGQSCCAQKPRLFCL